MSEEGYEYEDEDENSIKGLRRAANKSKKLEAEMNQMRRELAFARLGLTADDPGMEYFIKGYDGELDEDSIIEAAVYAGFVEIVEDDEEEQDPTDYYNPAQDRIMAAAAGGSAENVTEAAALSRMEEALAEGGVDAMLAVAQEYGIPTASDEY
tara:strand:- start:50 stop:508 length:459 start_codon:yes stop_codon:yes gene_type:complete